MTVNIAITVDSALRHVSSHGIRPTVLCFHCGLAVPAGARWQINLHDESHAVCCAGCEAVANTIVNAGMADYYARREHFPDSPAGRALLPDSLRASLASPAVSESICTQPAPDQRETVLLLEGLTCSACAWLSETRLRGAEGVVDAEVNYVTRRARVRWTEGGTNLLAIVDAIEAIGYRAWPASAKSSAELRRKESRDALLRLAVSALGMMQVMMYAFPSYIADGLELGADLEMLMRGASLLLTLPVVLYSAAPFFRSAWRDAHARRMGMDLPVSLGILAAFGASVAATLSGNGQVYFDSITMFVFLLLASRYLELRVRHRTAREVEYLTRALPAHARRLLDFPQTMDVATVAAAALAAGDYVVVCAGEVFPADGRVLDGTSHADESLLTGEARPQYKGRGSEVIGGATNLHNQLVVEVLRAGDATLLSHIMRLVSRAGALRPGTRSLTDRIAAWFVAGVLLLAGTASVYWLIMDSSRSLSALIAVLVVTCPCALSLAAPAALTAAVSSAAREGMLVTHGTAIETLTSVTHVVFDKTGTLTTGVMRIQEVDLFANSDRDRCLKLAAAAEAGSEHPAALAIVAAAGSPLPPVTQVTNFPGRGVEAWVEDRLLRIGRAEFVQELTGALPRKDLQGNQVWLGERGCVLSCISLVDSLKPGVEELTRRLRKRGLSLSILSGDTGKNVEEIARPLGIRHAVGALTPDQKIDAVREMQQRGAVVLMVGDGINDAPVLRQAQVSIAMGTGAALAQSTADMILLRGDLAGVISLLRLASRTTRIVKQNLVWATLYNVAAVPLAAAGLISPWIAGVGMAASSAVVVLNALRLAPPLRVTPPPIAEGR